MGEHQPLIRYHWDKDEGDEGDFVIEWKEGSHRHVAGYLMSSVFTQEVRTALDVAGYDITTLDFQIRKKPTSDEQLAVEAAASYEAKKRGFQEFMQRPLTRDSNLV